MSRQIADALVIFGITGDLAHRKILPSLYALERRGVLNVPVIGIARQDMSCEEIIARARDGIEQFGSGEVDEAVLASLAKKLNPLEKLVLSISPQGSSTSASLRNS